MINIFKLIRDTNGDALGVVLFILLIVYFALIENKTWVELFLLVSCSIALLVDIFVTWSAITKKQKQSS